VRRRVLAARSRVEMVGQACPAISATVLAAKDAPLAARRRPEIDGHPRPVNAMSKESSITKLARARKVILGLRKHFKAREVIRIEGKDLTREEVIGLFARHVAAIDAKRRRYDAYRRAVAEERELARAALDMWLGIHNTVSVKLGRRRLGDFGMRGHRKPGPKTTQAKLAGVQERAKKRAAK
jgi:hypothetical protein